MDRLADVALDNFDVRMIYRADRFGRGGDQSRMQEAGYQVWWRETTEAQWQKMRWAGPDEQTLLLPGVTIDNYFFGVAAVSPDGYASPVQFAGIVGAFFPAPPPPAQGAR